MDEKSKPATSYEVGYAKPPKATRFRKGESGNSKGRPKGAQTFATMVKNFAQEKLEVSQNGKVRKISRQEYALAVLLKKATEGNVAAMRHLLDIFGRHAENDGVSERSESEKALEGVDKEILSRFTLKLREESTPASASDNDSAAVSDGGE